MTQKTAKAVRLGYGIVLTAAAVIAGICLIGGALSIYLSGGEQIYTPEKVAQTFHAVSLPVWVFAALSAGAFLLEAILPPSPRAKSSPVPEMTRQRLAAQADMTYCGPKMKAAIEAERKRRTVVTGIGFGLLAVGSIAFLIYALNGSHFHPTDITGSMVAAVLRLLICLAIPFIYSIFAAYFCKKSVAAECALLKEVPKREAPAPAGKAKLPWLRWGLLAVALVIFAYGLLAGGTADVLTKAINICTECVGLG